MRSFLNTLLLRKHGFATVVLLLTMLCVTLLASADSHRIGVLYPDIREPYRSVFASIIDGIEHKAGGKVARYPLGKDVDTDMLRAWVEKQHINVIIALGRRSVSVSTELRSVPVVTGAVQMSPDKDKKTPGVALNPDPRLLFQQLKSLAPQVKQVSVVYNPDKNDWLIARARRASANQGLKLKIYPATDLRDAAKIYRKLLSEISGQKNAVWLLNDRSVLDQKAVFPLVLKSAWENEFVVFSNNPAHVKRGVLFAMFPDNEAMGKTLARIALRRVRSGSSSSTGIVPLSDLQIAFNLRTAEHLDLSIDRKQREQFDLVFPHR